MIEEADTYIRFYSISVGMLVIMNKYDNVVISPASGGYLRQCSGGMHL